MDRKETDTTLGRAPQSPLALNTIENTEESSVTLPYSTVPVTTSSTAYPHPVYKSPVADPNPALSPLEAQAALAADAHALAPFTSAGSMFAPPGSVFAPTTQTAEMMQAETVNAAIWQKLAHLVHTPPRFAGLWPFLTFAASVGIFASLISTNGWMLIITCSLLATFRKASRVLTVKADARDALNMAPFDLRWVAPLTRAINSPHTRVQGVSAQILACLLPRLRPEDAPLLNAEHRAILNQKLAANRRRDSHLNISILAAWGSVGDQEAVPIVDRLAHDWAWPGAKRKVRNAARKSLLELETRLEAEYAARMQAQGQPIQAPAETIAQSSGTRAVNKKVSEQLEKLEEEKRRHSNPGMRIGFLLASWLCIVPYTAYMAFSTWGHNWKLGASWALLSLLSTQLHRFTLSLRQSEEAQKLAQMDDVRGVGTLAEALEWPDTSIRGIAASALVRLLPRLTASDGNLLNPRQRANLYNILRPRNVRSQETLITAILEALKQVGDHAAIPAVERLMDLPTTSQRNTRIRNLATETRQFLDETAQQQSVSSTLLRASSAHDTPSELLLRGAMVAPEDAPQQLLRASVSEDSGT